VAGLDRVFVYPPTPTQAQVPGLPNVVKTKVVLLGVAAKADETSRRIVP